MNSSFPNNQIAVSRKSFLHKKISEAFNSEEVEKLSVLKSQWVHRYGFNTLPKEEELKESIFEAEDFNSHGIDITTNQALDKALMDKKEHEIKEQNYIEDQKEFKSNKIEGFQVEDISNDFESSKSNFIDESFNQEESSLINDSAPLLIPPPTPALNNLRKWLPNK